MEASVEPREASARRWKAGALPGSAALACLRRPCGRTGAVRVPPQAVSRSLGAHHAAQLVSTKSLCEVHTRRTPCIGAPQLGQRAARGGGGWRWRGLALAWWRLGIAGMSLLDQQANGCERDGTAGMQKAEVADFHEAVRQDMLEEAAEKLHDVELCRPWAGTAHFAVGAGDRAVREADETVGGDGHREDIGSEVRQGGVAVVMGLTVDIPGDGPDLGGDVLQEASLAHLFLEKRTGNGGERSDRDEEVGSRG